MEGGWSRAVVRFDYVWVIFLLGTTYPRADGVKFGFSSRDRTYTVASVMPGKARRWALSFLARISCDIVGTKKNLGAECGLAVTSRPGPVCRAAWEYKSAKE